MEAPISAASALHNVLVRVKDDPSANIYSRWNSITGSAPNTISFAEQHVEFVRLLQQVALDIQELPAAQQVRFKNYFYEWWDALVRPQSTWTQDPNPIISPAGIDALFFLANLIETRREQAPSDQQWERLRGTIENVLREVQETELPEHVRGQIVADLDHVIWLMENVDVYGVDRVVTATQEAAGRMASESARTGVKKLAHLFGATVIALNAFTGAVVNTEQTVELGMQAYESVLGIERHGTEDRDVIVNIIVPPQKQIASAPAETTDDTDSNVVEAEILEE